MKKSNPVYSSLNALLAGIERLFLSVVIGLIFPVLLGLAGWWGSIPLVPDQSIKFFALGGILVGVLIDTNFLRRWTLNALRIPLTWPVLVYLLYSVGMFGFFMGVPIFNILLGPVWGYYMGMRLRAIEADTQTVDIIARRSGFFTAIILGIACQIALILAYMDNSLEANIQSMLGLARALSKTAIMGMSMVGGSILVLLEYLITRASVKFSKFIK